MTFVVQRPWMLQPTQPVAIDWANTLTRGLVFAFSGAQPRRNAVTGQTASAASFSHFVSRYGIGARVSGTQEIEFASTSSLNVTGPITVAWVGFVYSASSYNALISKAQSNGGTNNPFDLWVSPPLNRFSFVRANSAGYRQFYYDGSNVLNTRAPNRYIAMHDGVSLTNPVTAFINGTITTISPSGGSGTGVPSASSVPLSLGRRDDGLQLDGAVIFAAVWNRMLTLSEALAVHTNPWCIFAPQRSIIPRAAASGAAPSISDLRAVNVTSSSVQWSVDYTFS